MSQVNQNGSIGGHMEYAGFDKNFRLNGKVAMVTGAARGIGEAIVNLLAEKGADIILVDLLEDVKKTAEGLAKFGVRSLPLVADLSLKENIDRIVGESIEAFGKIDILVNCAGVALLEDAEKLTEAYWDKTMLINLKAPFLLSQSVGREMIKARRGKIINIASQAAVIALDRHVAYCASKAALVSMTQVLAVEWAEYNINVNAISPTVILTDLGKKAWAGEVGEEMKKKIPVGRFGYPDEVAASVLFLASDAANLITGSNLIIDGGYSIQ
jgi:glycerol dehydrogenase